MGWMLLGIVVAAAALGVVEQWLKHHAGQPKRRLQRGGPQSSPPTVHGASKTSVGAHAEQSVEPSALHPFDVRSAPLAVGSLVTAARRACQLGDLGTARMCYQKAAYGFSQLTEAQNRTLKAEIALFAMSDGLYVEGMELVRERLLSTPGLLQSELGKSVGDAREALNYVLYYADLLGAVIRVKSGRSYRLYLPGQDMPEPSPPKPRRPAAASGKPKKSSSS